jgi:hypothetical protein
MLYYCIPLGLVDAARYLATGVCFNFLQRRKANNVYPPQSRRDDHFLAIVRRSFQNREAVKSYHRITQSADIIGMARIKTFARIRTHRLARLVAASNFHPFGVSFFVVRPML